MLTPFEIEVMEVLQSWIAMFTSRHVDRGYFTELMGKTRDIIKHLTNKKFGCPTGRHAGVCSCKKARERGF